MAAQLRICYRADFSQPKGDLNPGQFKFPGPVTVEIRKTRKGDWGAFRPRTRDQFLEVTTQPDAATLQKQMFLFFEKQLTKWVLFELGPDLKAAPLDPAQVYHDPQGRTYRKEIEQ